MSYKETGYDPLRPSELLAGFPGALFLLHATILHLLGIDHTRLTYRHSGRDFRLTDVSGRVLDKVIA